MAVRSANFGCDPVPGRATWQLPQCMPCKAPTHDAQDGRAQLMRHHVNHLVLGLDKRIQLVHHHGLHRLKT